MSETLTPAEQEELRVLREQVDVRLEEYMRPNPPMAAISDYYHARTTLNRFLQRMRERGVNI